MSDRLPYEEQLVQQWNDLPLPDENMAWADMKRRLEEDDDKGIIPIWLRGCGLWALIAIILLGIGWWIIRPDKWWNKKQETESVTTINKKDTTAKSKNKITANDTIQVIKSTGRKKITDGIKSISKKYLSDSPLTNLHPGQKKPLLKKKADISVQVTDVSSKKKETGSKQQTVKKNNKKNKNPDNKQAQKQTENEQVDVSITPGIKNKKTADEPVETKDNPVVPGKDSIAITIDATGKSDFLRNVFSDTTQKKKQEQPTKTTQQKKDTSKPKTISFSAGLGMHQLLPIDGQKLTPYNSAGRKGSLADYIPSVFARMYKNDKWFLELGFRYGAPQYTKEFLYQQKKDSVGSNPFTTTTSSKLKKTFYHQVPLTFNYFVLPNWSIGTGIVWNKFVSAISERQVNRRNNATLIDSLVSKGIITDKNDSIFKKSYFQAVFETQYRWRRFSIGARYSFGLQPYIKFTLPGGVQGEERNKSLQLFLRYELWKSKTKR